MKRYPDRRHVYTQEVGKLLPKIIGEVLSELGFNVWVNPSQGNDVDIKVRYNGDLTIVGEILNWSIGSLLSTKRCNKMISNLLEYACNKVLIYTVYLDNLSEFTRNGIDLLEIGYQVMLPKYYAFFVEVRKTTKRRIDSSDTRVDIKNKLENYIKNRNLLIIKE